MNSLASSNHRKRGARGATSQSFMADQQKKLKSQSEKAVQLAIMNKPLIDANTALNEKVKVLDKVEAKMQGDNNMELHN